MASNITETMSNLIGSMRQQAPSPGHVQIAPSMGTQKATNVSASIDLGAIMDLLGRNKEKQNKMLEMAQAQYTNDLQMKDQSAVDKEQMDNPFLQEVYRRAYEDGDPRFRLVEVEEPQAAIQQPNIPPNATPDDIAKIKGAYEQQRSAQGANATPNKKTYYLPKALAPSKEMIEAKTVGGMTEQEKKRMFMPQPNVPSVVGGMEGANVRQKYLAGMRYLGAPYGAEGGAEESPTDKRVNAELKSLNDYVKQWGKSQGIKEVDNPKINYVDNTKLASKVLQTVNGIKAAGGSNMEALGGVKLVGETFNKEMLKPMSNEPADLMRRKNYINQYATLLKELGPLDSSLANEASLKAFAKQKGIKDEDVKTFALVNKLGPAGVGEYARLMDWIIGVEDEQSAYDFMSVRGFTPDEIEQIYHNTKSYQSALALSQNQPEPEETKSSTWYEDIGKNIDRTVFGFIRSIVGGETKEEKEEVPTNKNVGAKEKWQQEAYKKFMGK